MSKGKMFLGQNVYREVFKIVRDSANMREVQVCNPYKVKAYRDAWIDLADYVFRTMKPESEVYPYQFMNGLVIEVATQAAKYQAHDPSGDIAMVRFDSYVEHVYLFDNDTPARRHAVSIVRRAMEKRISLKVQSWFEYSDILSTLVYSEKADKLVAKALSRTRHKYEFAAIEVS